MRKYFLAFFLCCLLLPLAGCFGKSDDSLILRYDLSGSVTSLDPQFTSSLDARTVLYNTMEGLYRLDASGELIAAGAQSHTVSSDGLVYTFTLRQDACWSDGTPVTAEDYQFAFRRMFQSGSISPHASKFRSIAGAQEILQGTGSVENLGVSAVDASTLVIRLAEADPLFLQLMADPAAFPCREDFYTQSKGRYALSVETFLSNGAFTVTGWDSSKSITLRPNTYYTSQEPSSIDGINFYIDRENPVEQFSSGKSDAIILDYSQYQSLGQWESAQEQEDTLWLLVFNLENSHFQHETLRRAMLSSIDQQALTQALPGNLSPIEGILPSGLSLGGRPYREMAGNAVFLSSQEPRELLIAALSELDLDRLPRTTLSYPADSGLESTAAFLQTAWGDTLSLYANLSPLPLEELESAVKKGEFDLALIPIAMRGGGPADLLSSLGTQFGWNEEEYLTLLSQIPLASSLEEMAYRCRLAEQWIWDQCLALPVAQSASYQATNPSIGGIIFLPDGTPYFKLAYRK